MTQAEKQPLVCTVDRKTWKRGEKKRGLMMINADGTKCCLGFLGEACGIASEELHSPMPFYLYLEDQAKYPNMVSPSGWFGFSLTNDDPDITDPVREQRLQELAEKAGFSFKFVG
jgi:hypothetical protein